MNAIGQATKHNRKKPQKLEPLSSALNKKKKNMYIPIPNAISERIPPIIASSILIPTLLVITLHAFSSHSCSFTYVF